MGILLPPLRGRSEAGLSRWPVTPEIAGSSPVAPEEAHCASGELLFFMLSREIVFIAGSSAGVARLVRDQEVGGSNPPCPMFYSFLYIDLSN